MRIKFVVLSALMGSLALLLGSTPGRTQFPSDLPGRIPAATVPGAAPDALHGRVPVDERVVGAEREGMAGLPGAGGEVGAHDPHAWMDERFRLLDRDGDGLLRYEEMTENLKAEKDKWDANKDGHIDLMEWREYVTAFLAQQRRLAADSSDGARPRGGKTPARGPRRRLSTRGQHEPGTIPSPLGMRVANTGPGRKVTAGPPPQSVAELRGQIGKSFYYEVTGAIMGGLWGTDVYTDDSSIATAAVHAGLLRVGETGILKLTVLPPQPFHQGTTRNGVTSGDFGMFGGAYRLEWGRGARPRKASRPPPDNVPPWFGAYDTDGDGQIALSEWKDKNGSVEDFEKLDLDGDGFITLQEARQATPTTTKKKNAPPWFQAYDTNGDGQISLSEWKDKKHSVEDFKKADLDRDGFITVEELIRAGFVPTRRGNVLILSSAEREYLRNLAQRSSWIYEGSEPLREGLRRLRAIGFIETPRANVYTLFDGEKFNLHDFARITERGRQFLRGRLEGFPVQ